ncbi:MAG: UDP-N-acetylglucosamine 1-carboxyvinyltransferase [candidate division Zixibacteria bacterium CG_4_9_14_3_um_filter_46_8]|nr:MAG: UDP-N-acetylglucosamine 1-carboxyvinyltransferase [candidate division Zixibacteria bacterium CG_4_9_14_3_um_filter_46_8]
MDKLVINGGKRLTGRIGIGGSKNSVLPILAGTILASDGECIIDNVPNIRDIDAMLKVLKTLGAEVNHDGESHRVIISAKNIANFRAPYELVRQMRASFLVMGPLLGRFGQAEVSLPGGCVLGARPVDLHIKGFQSIGAVVSDKEGYIRATAEKIRGGEAFFDRPSHTGTENIMLAGALGNGITRIVNAACDPEVVDLANFLIRMGARIQGAGSTFIEIEGVERLYGCHYDAMPDRLVAGTYACAVAIAGGELFLENARESDLQMPLMKLRDMGVDVIQMENGLAVSCQNRLKSVDITTFPFPGFPTDLQSCFMALCAVSDGVSNIVETVFENRMGHAMELKRLGADIRVMGDRAVISGVEHLHGASVMASDIRAGAALVVAALGAKGTTEILRAYHIDRGYENIDEALQSVGADIKRLAE